MKITYPDGNEKELETATHYIGVTMTLTGIIDAINEYKGVKEPAFVFIAKGLMTMEDIIFCSKSKSLAESGKKLLGKNVEISSMQSGNGRKYFIFEEVSNEENN